MLTPRAVDGVDFTVAPVVDGFVVRGTKPERWVRQTDFANDEAVGYLADRLARLGVEDELARQGAEPGAAVTIGDVTFDFEPTGGVEFTGSRRGSDVRLETNARARASDRLSAKRSRRVHEEVDGEWSDDGP